MGVREKQRESFEWYVDVLMIDLKIMQRGFKHHSLYDFIAWHLSKAEKDEEFKSEVRLTIQIEQEGTSRLRKEENKIERQKRWKKIARRKQKKVNANERIAVNGDS